MSTAGPTAEVRAGVELFERAVGFTRWVLADAATLPALNLTLPTPCAGWTLRDLLEHLDDSLDALGSAAGDGWVDLVPAPDGEPVDGMALLGFVRSRCVAALGAWMRPVAPQVSVAGQPLPTPLLAAAGALEVAVHAVDVARTLRLRHPLPELLARDLLAVAPLVISATDRGPRFDPPLALGGDACAADRLMGYTGRRPAAALPYP